MKYKLKNVFWLSGTNQDGYEKFIPIMFNKELNKIYLIKDDCTMFFFCSLSQEQILERITKCIENGSVNFVAPQGLFLTKTINLYYSPKLLLKSLGSCTFKNLPDDFDKFLDFDLCYIEPENFNKYCESENLSRRKVLSFKKAFQKAAKLMNPEKTNPNTDSKEIL